MSTQHSATIHAFVLNIDALKAYKLHKLLSSEAEMNSAVHVTSQHRASYSAQSESAHGYTMQCYVSFSVFVGGRGFIEVRWGLWVGVGPKTMFY